MNHTLPKVRNGLTPAHWSRRAESLFIATPPNQSSVWVRVGDQVSGAVFEWEIAAELAAATPLRSPRPFLNNGAAAAAVAQDRGGVCVETGS